MGIFFLLFHTPGKRILYIMWCVQEKLYGRLLSPQAFWLSYSLIGDRNNNNILYTAVYLCTCAASGRSLLCECPVIFIFFALLYYYYYYCFYSIYFFCFQFLKSWNKGLNEKRNNCYETSPCLSARQTVNICDAQNSRFPLCITQAKAKLNYYYKTKKNCVELIFFFRFFYFTYVIGTYILLSLNINISLFHHTNVAAPI